MYTYLIIALFVIIASFCLTSGNVIEGLVAPGVSPNAYQPPEITAIPNTSNLSKELNTATEEVNFFTENNINYKLLDTKIDFVERELNEIRSIYDKIKFSVNVKTIGSVPSIRIGGNYPSNIVLNTTLTPPEQGNTGDKGGDGDKGETGKKGIRGEQGSIGANQLC